MQEHRKHIRYHRTFKVVLFSPQKPFMRVKAITSDISRGGISLKLNKAIKDISDIRLKIFPSWWAMPVTAEGRLVWQKRCGAADEYRAGIHFTRMPWTQLSTLIG